jgi:hypothetical protein
MTETRLNLEQIIMQGLQEPQKPDCWCHDEPQMECPTHGSAEFYAHQCHELMVVNYLLANTIREIKLLADDLADDESNNEVVLLMLQTLGKHLDMTPEPEWHFPPYDPEESPF